MWVESLGTSGGSLSGTAETSSWLQGALEQFENHCWSPFDRLENSLELARVGRSDLGGPCLLGFTSLAHENVAHAALSPLPLEMLPCQPCTPISFVQKAREALGLHHFLCQTPHFSKPHFAIPAKGPLQRVVVKSKDDDGNKENPRPSSCHPLSSSGIPSRRAGSSSFVKTDLSTDN